MASRSSLRRIVDLVFFVAAVALLAYLLDKIGWSEIGRALVGLGVTGVIVIAALGFSENVFDAAALRAALRNQLGLLRVLVANSAGAFINGLLPWDLGEVAKGALLGSKASTHDKVSGIVLWNYAFKLSRPIVSLTAAGVGALLWDGLPPGVLGVVFLANLAAFVPYLVLRVVIRAGAASKLVRLLKRIPRLGARADRLVDAAQRLDDEVRDFAKERPGAYATIVLTQIGARLSSWMALYAITHFLGFGFSFGQVALIYAGLNVAEYVITVLPARIGVAEGAAFGLFQVYGLEPAAGVLMYLVLRLKNLATNGVVAPLATYTRR